MSTLSSMSKICGTPNPALEGNPMSPTRWARSREPIPRRSCQSPLTTALASSALMNVDPSSGLTTVPTAGIYAVPTTAKPPTAKAAAAAKAATDAPDAADTPPAGAPAAVTPPPPGGSVGVDVALAQLAVPGD